MIQGIGTTSLRKQDVASQKTPATGFKKIVFAHKATAGNTGIDLTALSLPPEMPGFTNPNVQELQAANLLFYRKNLTLVSSLRGVLIDYMSYEVMSNTAILFSDDFGTALEGEVFVGTIDHSVSSGNMVVDAEQIGASGVLTANTTDFNVGTPFTVNAYPNRQFGEVMVWLDGVLQYRNTSNSSTNLDGNYYEVDAGGGTGVIIRFNEVDTLEDRDVIVAGIGVVAERPNGSMMAAIESIAGKVDSMASVVSDLSGLTEYQIVGANPSSVDLKAFGDRVLALESNRARIDLSNTWTAYQQLLGRTNGTAVPAGYIGEVIRASQVVNAPFPASASYGDGLSVPLTAGIWRIDSAIWILRNGATLSAPIVIHGVSTTTGNSSVGLTPPMNYSWTEGMSTTFSQLSLPSLSFIVVCDGTTITRLDDLTSFAAGTTLYQKLYFETYSVATPQWRGKLTATRIG